VHEPTPTVAFSCDDLSPRTNIDKLKELLRIIDRFDAKGTFFVIPKSHDAWNSCGSLIKILKDVQTCGHEIGLHGLSHLPFETANPFPGLNLGFWLIRDKVTRGLRIFNERLEVNPKGFRAPYHHYSKSLLKALDDLHFLYDSSKMPVTSVLLSYAPPLRAMWLLRKRTPIGSRIFHPFNLKLLEIPITQEYTWYNLRIEVDWFAAFFKNSIPKLQEGCLVVNSHIGALTNHGLGILKKLFLCVKDAGLSTLPLQEVAEKIRRFQTAKAYYY